jgi:U3 small nucleolar RNA-associated protein 12
MICIIESTKLWNVRTKQCLKTFHVEMASCGLFVPGDRHVLLGTKSGVLNLFDVSTSLLVDSVQAHGGPIFSMNMRPDRTGFVTGSGDKEVKFWDFELVAQEATEHVSLLSLFIIQQSSSCYGYK